MSGFSTSILLLSLSPVVVALLHALFGLPWRADHLLGRLDTVLSLESEESRDHKPRQNLQFQLLELLNEVTRFASYRKLARTVRTYEAIESPEKTSIAKKLFLDDKNPGFVAAAPQFMKLLREGVRFLVPALFLGIAYWIGFRFIREWIEDCLADFNLDGVHGRTCLGCNLALVHIECLVYCFLGSFVFNTGIMVRRIFVWDISGQMFWWAFYRLVLSLGIAEILHFSTANLDARLYFLIAAGSVWILDGLVRSFRSKLFQSDAVPKQSELSLQLIQGIDYWKEQRLMEEGIESVQHLATADFVLLALHTRLPLFTIMDWVDQAIVIQRFPSKADKLADQGLPVSAVELTWGWDPCDQKDPCAGYPARINDSSLHSGNSSESGSWDGDYLEQLAKTLGTTSEIVARTVMAWKNDNQVQLLTLFWRADLGSRSLA